MANTVGNVEGGFVSMAEVRRVAFGSKGLTATLAETVLALHAQLQERKSMSDEPKVVTYEHHGAEVSVREDLKGMHRDNCLCYQPCGRFNPENRAQNCKIANALFDNCVEFNVVTPVYECPAFITPEDLAAQQQSPKRE